MANAKNLNISELREQVCAGNTESLKKLSAAGYVGANSIHEVPDFLELVKLQESLQKRYYELQKEQLDLREKLKYNSIGALRIDELPVEEVAAKMVSGTFEKVYLASIVEDLQAKEIEIRRSLENMYPVLLRIPSKIERIRTHARAVELASDKRSEEIRKSWKSALSALKSAVLAEDAFLNELAARGFGRDDPTITVLPGLNRYPIQHLKLEDL